MGCTGHLSELIQAKLDVPLADRAYKRERLLQTLALAHAARLVCLRAGPGFGKTFLVADYLRRQEVTAAWVQVDRADQDPARLSSYIWAALERAAARVGCRLPRGRSGAEALGSGEYSVAQILGAVETLVAGLASPPLVIVLNDLDLAASEAICDFVSQLVEYLPAGATLWFTCRNLPQAIALPRLRSLRLAVEIGPDELSLTPSEVPGFCREVLGVELDPWARDLVYQATSGWIAGLILLGDWAAQSGQTLEAGASRVLSRIGRGGDGGDSRGPHVATSAMLRGAAQARLQPGGPLQLVLDYIASEILVRQDVELTQLLSATAVLPFVSVDAAAGVTGLADREEISRGLSRIAQEIPLVSRLDHGRLSYHPMLRAALLDRIATHEGEAKLKQYHLAAGSYLRDHGWPEGAVDCFIQAGADEQAVALLRQWAFPMALEGRVASVTGWLDALTPAVIEREPRLLAALGVARQVKGMLDEALSLWQRALVLLEAPVDSAAGESYEVIAMCRALMADVLAQRGRAREGLLALAPALALPESALPARRRARLLDALAYCQWLSEDWDQAWRTVEQAGSWYARAGDAFGQATALNILAGTYHEPRGELNDALACFERAIALVSPYGTTPQRLLYTVNRGNILTCLGRLREAVGVLESAVQAAGRAGTQRPLMLGLLFLCIVYLDLGRITESRQAGEQCLAIARDMGDKLRIGGAKFVLANVHRTRGELDMALQLATEDLDLMRELGNSHFLLQSLVNTAFVHLHRDEPAEAEAMLLEADQSAAGRVLGIEGFGLYLALAAARLGRDPAGCRDAVERCLGIAQGRSVTMVLRREAEVGLAVLRWARGQGIRSREVTALLDELVEQERTIAYGDPAHGVRVDTVTGETNPDRDSAARVDAALIAVPGPGPLPPDARSGLAVRCLGQFGAWVDGREVAVTAWHKSKALRLFKLLLTYRERWLPVEQVLEMLWPEMDAESGLANFRVTLHYARRALRSSDTLTRARQFILYEHRRCRVNPRLLSWVDADEFSTLARAGADRAAAGDVTGAMEAYVRAAELYRGDFLPDDVYEDWAQPTREHLRRQVVGIHEWLATRHAGQGNHRDAAGYLRQAVALDPYREDLHRELMLELAADGRIVEALQQFRRCEQALVKELGIGPAAETLDLYRRLMREQPASAGSAGAGTL